MKFATTLLPLAALSTAFIVPDEAVTEQIALQSKQPLDKLQAKAGNYWKQAEHAFKDAVAFSENALDNVLDAGRKTKDVFECHMSMTKFDMEGWLETNLQNTEDPLDVEIFDHSDHKPHPPHHKPPHHPPHHGDPHNRHSNKTVYQLIASSKYTTKLASLINEYPDLVDVLNGTTANYTVFAPTDKAFEKLPKHHKPSKELIKKVLAYHVSPDFYPAGRVLITHTIPTALGEDALGGAQRLRVGLNLRKGLNINFYSRIIAANIFGSNGVIHGIDSLLLPPPPALKIIDLFPGEFSTLTLGLQKTGLYDEIADAPHVGGTLFAPSNWAFRKLGPKINAFLFSNYGQKYLKALLKYHIVANQTLYSDAFYQEKESTSIPKGHFHVDLPTLLEDKSLSVDIARFGGFITIKINGFSTVAIQDGLARDGVIHILSSVLIPPKTPGGAMWAGEEMSVEEFKERFDAFEREL